MAKNIRANTVLFTAREETKKANFVTRGFIVELIEQKFNQGYVEFEIHVKCIRVSKSEAVVSKALNVEFGEAENDGESKVEFLKQKNNAIPAKTVIAKLTKDFLNKTGMFKEK